MSIFHRWIVFTLAGAVIAAAVVAFPLMYQSVKAAIESVDQNLNIHGKTVFSSEQGADMPIRNRRIGYVFQDYALFPHMTVEKNVMYGKPKKGSIPNKALTASNVLEMLKIEHLQNRYPNQISGGGKSKELLSLVP